MTDVQNENEEARQKALQRLRAKHEAYVKVFGLPGQPTVYGAIILDDLDAFCTSFKESVHFDQSGRMDPFTTIYRDGKKAVALRIREMIEWRHGDGDSS